MTALVLALALAFSSPAPAGAANAHPLHAMADSADVWHVYVDGQDVLRSDSVETAGAPAELSFSRINFRSTLTVHYLTEAAYPRARTLEFVDPDGLVMFSYEEMEESEDNPIHIPLDALSLALGGAPEGPLSVLYRESSGGTITRDSTVLFVISPD